MPSSSLFRRGHSRGMGCLLGGMFLGTAYGIVLATTWRLLGKQKQRGREAVRPRVVCFGDSLTQFGHDPNRDGWLALLAHWWERRVDVVNRGFSGYNTRWLLPLAERLFVDDVGTGAAPTTLVTVFLGANDCVLPGNAQHVPIHEYKSNLKAIVAHVHEVHPGAKVLLITPPPIHEVKWASNRASQQREMDRKLEVTMSYAEACVEVASETSVPVVDTFNIMGSGDVPLADKFLHDGVHFTADGNRVLFEAVQTVILKEFPELDPASLSMQAPYFADIDPANPTESVLREL